MLVTVFGKRGSGKTTLIRALIPEAKKPVIVIDVLANYWPKREETTDTASRKYNDEEWILCMSTEKALDELKKYLRNPDDHVGVIVVSDSNAAMMVDYMSAALCQDKVGGTMVFDEVDFVTLAEAPAFDDLVRYGRNKGVDLVTGCRRPAELSKNITAGADLFLCFRTHEPRDVDYFSKIFGEALSEKLMRLPKHHGIFLDHTNETEGTFKTEKDGEIVVLTEKPLDSMESDEDVPEEKGTKRKKDSPKSKDDEVK